MKVGAHLVVNRGMYTHHGLYTGGDGVIHYSGLAKGFEFPAGPVEIVGLKDFMGGETLRVRRHDNAAYDGEAALARAFSRIGEDRYDLFTNNCEHLCTWAITGKSTSEQADRYGQILSASFPDFADYVAARRYYEDDPKSFATPRAVTDKEAWLPAGFQLLQAIGVINF